MIGLGTKALLIAFSGFSGVAGWASFSAPNWDPKELWRITHDNKFYLSNCFNDPSDKGTHKWTDSNLWIYLIVKGQVSDIKADTELELWAEGWGKRMEKEQAIQPTWYVEKSLQGSVEGDGEPSGFTSTDYELTKWPSPTLFVLGETGGGEENQIFGDTIKCNNKVFGFNDSEDYKNYRLDKVTFKLKNIDGVNAHLKDKYKGHNIYSIEIKTSETTGLGEGIIKWADNFKPIVIV
ncbi:hypothetical protein WEN_03100 [Mycoplasma wenyonii str. Massachusetts]|uniref:Uncharacterized protein n=1 Tax=Mycoplasma wenyonii (strain Massachusetts) TaxID=1197325 RepID=I6YBL7_MYCWM|nr:hypothetical protein [Mycoplasma wenyonii]AFN65401.1 hypothetical protein WEN_03100 [Mycoplasma wenyonii str. Massachusetts]